MAKEKGVIVAGTEAHERTKPDDQTMGKAQESDGKPAPKPKPKSKIIADQ